MNLDYKKFNEKILIMQHLRWAIFMTEKYAARFIGNIDKAIQ